MARKKTGILLTALACTLAVAALAQDEIEPPARPVSIFLRSSPTVNVAFDGERGSTRLTGTLTASPVDPLRLTDVTGHPRNAEWTEIRNLELVRIPAEGLPQGAYTTVLLTDPSTPSYGGPAVSLAFPTSGAGQANWRALDLPKGDLTLKGDAFGTVKVPLARVTSLSQEPLRGTVTDLPKVNVRIEVLRGTVVNVPLQNAISFRRDVKAGTASVSLNDGQIFTGRLVELPNASVKLDVDGKTRQVPLDQIAEVDVTVPALSAGIGPSGR